MSDASSSIDEFEYDDKDVFQRDSRIGRVLNKLLAFLTPLRLFIALILCLLAYTAYSFTRATHRRTAPSDRYGTFLLFGDSITQASFMVNGTGSQLADHYQRKLDVINRGFSGYPSSAALHILPEMLVSLSPTIMWIWFGANDAAQPLAENPLDPSQKGQIYPHVPIDEYRSNLIEIIASIPSDICLLLLTPPPFSTELKRAYNTRRGRPEYRIRRSEESARLYAEACVEIGQDIVSNRRRGQFAFVNLHTEMEKAALQVGKGNRDEGMSQYFDDGLHPNSQGYQLITPLILQAIERACPELAPDQLRDRYPQSWPDGSL